MKINFGCGKDYREGWLNCDNNPNVKSDMIINLNEFPYGIEDNMADEIIMSHVFEHLDHPISVINELWRISKPKAIITITVPFFDNSTNFQDLTHKRQFCGSSFDKFRSDGWYYDSPAKLKVIKRTYYALRRSGVMPLALFGWLEYPFINMSRHLTDNLLRKFMHISEIEFKMEVIK